MNRINEIKPIMSDQEIEDLKASAPVHFRRAMMAALLALSNQIQMAVIADDDEGVQAVADGSFANTTAAVRAQVDTWDKPMLTEAVAGLIAAQCGLRFSKAVTLFVALHGPEGVEKISSHLHEIAARLIEP